MTDTISATTNKPIGGRKIDCSRVWFFRNLMDAGDIPRAPGSSGLKQVDRRRAAARMLAIWCSGSEVRVIFAAHSRANCGIIKQAMPSIDIMRVARIRTTYLSCN
jgi:hypothetical protein